MTSDPLLGRTVEVRSPGGILYCGTVVAIHPDEGTGEILELGPDEQVQYRRFVYVVDRDAQIRLLEP
jgi:hypothetical protein